MKRIFAIGDIHGCLDKLQRLLERIPIDWKKDEMVLLGDYIDRGPQSFGVIELLLALKQLHGERICFLKGNHEWMFLEYLNGRLESTFLINGGTETLESYRLREGRTEIPKAHMDFLLHLDILHETEHYVFVHAGLRPGVPVSAQSSEDCLWIRSVFIESDYDWGKRVIFGHTPFSSPLIRGNKLGIDTGAVYGGKLTCVVLPDCEFVFA